MRFAKYLVVLTLAFLACVSYSKAATNGTVLFVGGGSSALFLEVGQAAAAYEQHNAANTNGSCVYSYKTNTADWSAKDSRPSVYSLAADVQEGKIWIVYGTGTGGTCAAPVAPFNIYSYMSLDSVLGNRCFFEVDTTDNNPGCIQVATPTVGEALPGTPPELLETSSTACTTYVQANYCDIATTGSAVSLPSTVYNALNGLHWNFAGTDVRPEDGKFASYRVLTTCGTGIWRQPFDQGLRQVYGLGYQTANAGIGTTIQESTFPGNTSQQFTVLDFSLSGNDPINASHSTYNSYTVSPVGAQPIIVAVGPAGAPWTGVTDATGFELTLFYQGVLGRTTDFVGATSTYPVTTLVREPLSGTYNTFEYSVPNTSQFHGSQDDNNCSGTSVYSNPMDLGSANGQYIGPSGAGWKGNGYAYRERLIGTGDMVAGIQNGTSTAPTLGYWFWSAANGKNFTSTNGKYLTLDGVDPFFATCGANPAGCGVVPTGSNLSSITFANLQAGDYAAWSPLRLVTSSGSVTPSATGLANIMSGLATYINPTQHDYVPISNLTVWHSHYYLPAINVQYPSANGTLLVDIPNNGGPGTTLCPASGAVAELGGDAGGSNLYTQANYDFCTDFGNTLGLINKAN